ncbi:MAG: hypothetical protein AB1552_10695 [Nitrospirota bacterium]
MRKTRSESLLSPTTTVFSTMRCIRHQAPHAEPIIISIIRLSGIFSERR